VVLFFLADVPSMPLRLATFPSRRLPPCWLSGQQPRRCPKEES
jgi:hypothetical protein